MPTESLNLTVPDQTAAAEMSKKLLAQNFAITDDDMHVAAWAVIQKHDELIEKLTVGKDTFVGFNPLIDSLHKAHKNAIAIRDQFLTPILASRRSWLQRYDKYKNDQLAAAKAQADAAAEALRKEQAKQLEKDAKVFEKKGDVESATVLREQARTMPAPTLPVVSSVQKQVGEVDRGGWKFEVENYDQVPAEYKTLDHTKKGERELIDSKLRAVVGKLGDKIKIAGIRVWHETSTGSRKV